MQPVSAQQPAGSREHPSPGDSAFRDSRASRVTTTFGAVGKVPAGRGDGAARLQHRPSRPGCGGPAVRSRRRAGAAEPARGAAEPGPAPRRSQGGSRYGGGIAPSSPGPLRDAHGRTPGIPRAGGGGGGGGGEGRMPATVPAISLPRPAPEHGDGRREQAHSPLSHHQRALDPQPPRPGRGGRGAEEALPRRPARLGSHSAPVRPHLPPRWEPSLPPEPPLSPCPGEERERRGLGEGSGSGRERGARYWPTYHQSP